MAVVEQNTVFQGDSLNLLARDVAVFSWTKQYSKSRVKLASLPHDLRKVAVEAQSRIAKDAKMLSSLKDSGPLLQRLASSGRAALRVLTFIQDLEEDSIFEEILSSTYTFHEEYVEDLSRGAPQEVLTSLFKGNRQIKSQAASLDSIKHEHARTKTVWADVRCGSTHKFILTEDAAISELLNHIWREPFPVVKSHSFTRNEDAFKRALCHLALHLPLTFASMNFGAAMAGHGSLLFRRDEHLLLADSSWEFSKLRHFLRGDGQISKLANIPLWNGRVPMRRIGETLFWKSPCSLAFAGAPDAVPAFCALSWEDKLVKIFQGPFLTSITAALDIGGNASSEAFDECTSSDLNGIPKYAPQESTEVRIKLVHPDFERKVSEFENRLAPVLREVGRLADGVDLANANAIAEVYNNASIGGKTVWYIMQNLVPEPGDGLFKELPNAIAHLGGNDVAELMKVPELSNSFAEVLLKFCLGEGKLRGYVHSYNLARLYSAVPCPASTRDDAEASLKMILEKGAKFKSMQEEEAVMRNYFLAAVSSQKELKAAYAKTNQPLRDPSTYNFETGSWVRREHWASGLSLWALLTDDEKRAAEEADFSVNEVPVDAAEVYWASTQSKGAMFEPDTGEVALETVEALKSAPLMWSMSGRSIRRAGATKRYARLVSRKKTESGKWAKKKTRHFWVASFPAKCVLRTYNNNSRTVVSLLPHFAPGASGKQRLQSKKAVCTWLDQGRLRFVESSDRVAWSESQIHRAIGVIHRMIEGCVGLEVGTWSTVFAKLEVGALDSKSLTFGTRRSAVDKLHQWVPVRQSVTFQGFTIFPDTAAHRSMQRGVNRDLYERGHVSRDAHTATFMDDIINASELTRTDDNSLDGFVTSTR